MTDIGTKAGALLAKSEKIIAESIFDVRARTGNCRLTSFHYPLSGRLSELSDILPPGNPVESFGWSRTGSPTQPVQNSADNSADSIDVSSAFDPTQWVVAQVNMIEVVNSYQNSYTDAQANTDLLDTHHASAFVPPGWVIDCTHSGLFLVRKERATRTRVGREGN